MGKTLENPLWLPIGECRNDICEAVGKCKLASMLYGPRNTGQLPAKLFSEPGSPRREKGHRIAVDMLRNCGTYQNRSCPNYEIIIGLIYDWIKAKRIPLKPILGAIRSRE